MPTFATPEPILADLEPVVGNVRIVASDRTDTVVEVVPLDASNASDVKAAEQTVVEFSGGKLSVRAPKGGLSRGAGGFVGWATAGLKLIAHRAPAQI